MSEPVRKTLLIVDDEDDVRDLIGVILDGTEYDCIVAASFSHAVDIVSESPVPIDILLTDIILPPYHGRDLANKLVRIQPRMKVLFMSGYPLKLLRKNGLIPPQVDYLAKPFTRSQLLKTLDHVVVTGTTWSELTAART